MGRVEGKVCIVTGAADGLGKADAIVLAREGASVVITDINEEVGRRTAEEIGERALFVRQDVRDEDGWRELVAMVENRFGRLDVLVNNAGVLQRADIESATLESWRFVMGVNVEGCFLGIKHCAPALRRTGAGSIINMSSTAVLQGYPGAPSYVAAKGAISALTRAVAMHFMQKGEKIRCNAVLPHNAESPMQRAGVEERFAGVPLDQRPKIDVGSPFAIANAVLFLASDESSDINGWELNMDRGSSLIVGSL
jgi:3(or 17)beta-hydroxysteroid dehydrogenase